MPWFISDVVDLYRVLLSQPATVFFISGQKTSTLKPYQAQNGGGQLKHQYKVAVQDCYEINDGEVLRKTTRQMN